MYPSITNDYVSPEKAILKRNIEKSTIFFLVIATRGFDMTLIPCDWCRIKVSKKL
jgi:hypothetical protein